MDASVDKRAGKRSRLSTILWGGRHARPLIPTPKPRTRGAGRRSARTAVRMIGRLRFRFAAAGALLLVAALAVGVSPTFRHYLQDRTTAQLLEAARASQAVNISINDYVSSDNQEVPILDDQEEAALNGADASGADTSAPEQTPPPGFSVIYPAETSSPASTGSAANGGLSVTILPPDANAPKKTPKPASTATAAPKQTIVTLGIMRIPVVDLEMPIAEGAGTSELRYALGHHSATPPLGAIGYSTVFGHRMYTYGRHFNRLDELVPGDEIFVTVGGQELRYIVDEKGVVLPEEVPYYMKAATDKSRLLLVTCTPVRVADHRLLVFCTLDRDEVDGGVPAP